jgi:hypothetical protein
MPAPENRRRLSAIRVHQWLPEWEEVDFNPDEMRGRPPEDFYLFTLGAAELRALAGISRRSTEGGVARSRDLGIQRRHEVERSNEIREYVQHGYPWSSLGKQQKASGKFDDLKKPGWLPTAIVVNILRRDEHRDGKTVHQSDVIDVVEEASGAIAIQLPQEFEAGSWEPASSGTFPLEVIDGQHRLWSFDSSTSTVGYSLPVVAFHGLDRSWQAYLFYTINIKPKRINASLAYDLYPLLRTADWLERFEGHSVYRETRAQEITEALWSYPDSPWHDRIDMLGGSKGKSVTQAAWIRSLLATFVKSFDGRGKRIGGLFGAPSGGDKIVLGWSRPQQSAFVVLLWQELQEAVGNTSAAWAIALREAEEGGEDGKDGRQKDKAFSGRFSLLNTDMGVRGVLAVANDLCYLSAKELDLDHLGSQDFSDGTAESAISSALEAFREAPVTPFVQAVCATLAEYDWRTSAGPGLPDDLKAAKGRFRGNGGYRELHAELLHYVARSTGEGAQQATLALKERGF